MQDVANKIENGANFVSGNEDKAQQALSTISRKFNA
jgi:ethanolamine utilization microcompartment shell protein EutL